MGVGGNEWRRIIIMKLHTLDREYCVCTRHPRKFKKRLTILNKKFNKAIDSQGIIPFLVREHKEIK